MSQEVAFMGWLISAVVIAVIGNVIITLMAAAGKNVGEDERFLVVVGAIFYPVVIPFGIAAFALRVLCYFLPMAAVEWYRERRQLQVERELQAKEAADAMRYMPEDVLR